MRKCIFFKEDGTGDGDRREEKRREEKRREEKRRESMTGVKVKSSLDVYHLTQKFNPKVVKISSYLSLFERQVKRAKVPEELWVSHLIGLLPNDMAQLIDKEPEEVAED
ncbi:hypothetical protein AVEN_260055-1 [Araneus ventricosus]|uniref:Uncharacterized protein n=1 Tax=Araneus ventricosus TaxID=182803 RepID=A0A4Y2WDV2_ARAVE|nr:hypothetical protein AVEN_260055-1 [Araneus ventricosus]